MIGVYAFEHAFGFRDGGRHEQPPTVEQQKPEGKISFEGSGFGCPKGLGFGTPPNYKI